MSYCAQCGFKQETNARFCVNCGKAVDAIQSKPQAIFESSLSDHEYRKPRLFDSTLSKVFVVIAIVAVLLVVIIGLATKKDNKEVFIQSSTPTDTIPLPPKMAPKRADLGIGSTANIGYFDVTLHSAIIHIGLPENTVSLDGDQDDGQYVEMVIEYRNTDSESRMTDPGYITIENEGKRLIFDARANLIGEGYWVDKQLNPLLSHSGRIFFKIPSSITGVVRWVPGRNSKDIEFIVGRVS